MISFNDKTIVVVSHIFTTGPSQELENYLKDKAGNLFFIGHPFNYAQETNSFFRFYSGGKLCRQAKAPNWKLPGILWYLKDVMYTLVWMILFSPKADFFIGVDNLNAVCGLVLKFFGKVKKTVYYTIDYNPQRFKNGFLNFIYHRIDSICVKFCDKTWNLSSGMVVEREKKGLSVKYKEKQITVPIGTDIEITPKPYEAVNRFTLIYMGVLLERQGLQLVISILPRLKERFPEIKLLVIGAGPYKENLKKIVCDLKLEKEVEFKGLIESHQEVLKLLSVCAIGLAAYVQDKDNPTQYTDPGKPKAYLSAGVPVIITKVPQVAFEIEKEKCGFAIDYDEENCFQAIGRLLEDDILFKEFRNNARRFALRYTWDKIFQSAFRETI